MAKGLLGYGRYDDDPSHVGCPQARSDMTPCVARDGRTADEAGVCVGCGVNTADAFTELVKAVTDEMGDSDD